MTTSVVRRRAGLTVISTDGINETQSAQIQQVIEEHGEDWWHQQSHMWIVRSTDRSTTWRDRLAAIFHAQPATLLVFQIDANAVFAARAPGGVSSRLGTDWLKSQTTSLRTASAKTAD